MSSPRRPKEGADVQAWLFKAQYPWRKFLRGAKNALGHEPAFLPLLLRLTPRGVSRQITDSTQLVIEGFPRSGNTFTTFAIGDACNHQITIASHVHQPSQIKNAIARGVPTVFVIRDPVFALASYLAWDQRFSASAVIREYCSYHRQLVPYADRFLICEFDEITSNISTVIERINRRYSLNIPPFDEGPSNVKRLFAQIEWADKLVHPRLDPVRSVPGPHADRRKINEQMREALLHPSNATQLAVAQDLFAYFCNVASRQKEMMLPKDHEEERSSTE